MTKRQKIKINDISGTNTKYKCQHDKHTVRIKHYNDNFKDVIEIPTEVFIEIAFEVLNYHKNSIN